MTTWIIPNKAEEYDIHKGLVEYGDEIEWTKKLPTTNIATGDIVYIYESKPVQKLTMKFVVTDHNIVVPRQTHRNDGAVIGNKWFGIRFLENIEPISYDALLHLGIVNGYIQAARRLTADQETKLNRHIAANRSGNTSPLINKVQSNSDMTTDEIAEEIVGIDSLNSIMTTLQLLQTSLPPQRIRQVVSKLVRNPRIALLVKQDKKYICEVCGRKPFIKKNGGPYAEADHIQPLGGNHNGLDSPENIRCLCAQCHRIITYGSDEVIQELLSSTRWRS